MLSLVSISTCKQQKFTYTIARGSCKVKTRIQLQMIANYLVPHGNALILAIKIPGAWLVQIKNAGHAIMDQYPAEVSEILNTFLSTVPNN